MSCDLSQNEEHIYEGKVPVQNEVFYFSYLRYDQSILSQVVCSEGLAMINDIVS